MANEMVSLGEGAAAYLAKFGEPTRGAFVKFNKEGKFIVSQSGDVIPSGTQCVCIYDQTRAGWIKFQGKGNEPVRHMGPIFGGFDPPERETLGDLDPEDWEIGLNGKPSDPWLFQIMLPLQNTENGELYVFATHSLSGRRAVNDLIRRCQKLHKEKSDQYPVIRLVSGEYKHPKFGSVKVPQFDITTSAPKGDYKAVSLSEDLDDTIPF